MPCASTELAAADPKSMHTTRLGLRKGGLAASGYDGCGREGLITMVSLVLLTKRNLASWLVSLRGCSSLQLGLPGVSIFCLSVSCVAVLSTLEDA